MIITDILIVKNLINMSKKTCDFASVNILYIMNMDSFRIFTHQLL